jgi:hypothetical protein
MLRNVSTRRCGSPAYLASRCRLIHDTRHMPLYIDSTLSPRVNTKNNYKLIRKMKSWTLISVLLTIGAVNAQNAGAPAGATATDSGSVLDLLSDPLYAPFIQIVSCFFSCLYCPRKSCPLKTSDTSARTITVLTPG